MSKRPVQEIRFGLIKAAIWENQTRNGLHYKVTLVRLFKDGQSWRESTRFDRDDLPLVAKAADLAHTWIYEHAHQVQANGNGTAT
jgi:hypothetical protein